MISDLLIQMARLQYFGAELNCLLQGRDFYYTSDRSSAQTWMKEH